MLIISSIQNVLYVKRLNLTVNDVCSFRQLTGIWGPPPKISETTGCTSMKFLPDVKLHKAKNPQKDYQHCRQKLALDISDRYLKDWLFC